MLPKRRPLQPTYPLYLARGLTVADATANAPKILVSTTPSAPAVPGQSVLASVRADAWSGIASVVVDMRDSQSSEWRSLALDAAGRVKLLPAQPGLIELRVTATDRDGFVSRRIETLRVKDPADTTAPLLTWTFADGHLAQQKDYLAAGGRFIVPVPQVRIL